eukprot:TRINITY_DN763_c0_g1_i1.p1 TRINITY_DN763_c0_g1~~TRINITY_DN763_c0_g1_i1.p1  ORF type:complete len:2725 (-),score=542.23 TRINITY_DN763_c0_g1_i1:43-7140(-)
MSRWLVDNAVINAVFARCGTHPDLVASSLGILQYMATQHVLTCEHLKLIWDSCTGKSDSASAMFALLENLEPVLTRRDRTCIYQQIRRAPHASYTDELHRFVTSFCCHACARDPLGSVSDVPGETVPIGVEVMWELMQDESPVSTRLVELSIESIQEILYKDATGARHVLGKCIANLHQHKSVPQSLTLIQRLLVIKPSGVALSDVINEVEATHGVLPLFFTDLEHWRQKVKELYCDLSAYTRTPEFDSVAQDQESNTTDFEHLLQSVVPGTKFRYRAHQNLRLEFLHFFIHNSRLTLTVKFLDALWRAMATGVHFPQERDALLHWLQQLLPCVKPGTTVPCLDPGAPDHLLLHLLPTVPHRDYTQQSFAAFTHFFAHTNTARCAWDLPSLDNADAAVRWSGAVHDARLVGIDTAWGVALGCNCSAVSERAVQLLLGVLCNSAAQESRKLREEFADRCLTDLGGAPSPVRAWRCLCFLKRFVECLGPKERYWKRNSYGVFTQGRYMLLVLRAGTNRHALWVHQSQTVASFTNLVANRVLQGTDPARLRLTHNGEPVGSASATLLQCGVRDEVAVTIVDSPAEVETEAKLEAAPPYSDPTIILSQPERFCRLFDLLSYGEAAVRQQAWKLVRMLPPNADVQQRLGSIVCVPVDDWQHFLESDSPLKLLYHLGLMDLLLVSSSNAKEEERNAAWRAAFIAQGGPGHLIGLLMGSAPEVCTPLLLRVVNFFYVENDKMPLGEDEATRVSDVLQKAVWCITPGTEGVQTAVLAADLLAACVKKTHRGVTDFITRPEFDEWIYNALATIKNTDLFFHFTSKICTITRTPLSAVVGKLMKCVPPECELRNYVQLLVNFIAAVCETNNGADVQALAPLFETLVQFVRDSPAVPDVLMLGSLELLTAITSRSPQFKIAAGQKHNLISELLCNLFGMQGGISVPPKCRTQESRDRALQLLMELCTGCPENFVSVLPFLFTLHEPPHCTPGVLPDIPSSKRSFWNFVPVGDRAACGFVGLDNTGTSCYLNSVLQLMFMHAPFRDRLLHVSLPPALHHEDSVVYQLRELFAYLQASNKKSVDTSKLCAAMHVDTTTQMGADEFFLQLCDALTAELAHLDSGRDMLREWFGGLLCHQVASQECPHVSERDEDFFALSLTVKGLTGMRESLAQLVEGDQLVEDNKYLCDSCAKKVDAVNRCCLSELPLTLVINCRRFDYVYLTMAKVKLDNLWEFPLVVDLWPFTRQFLFAESQPPCECEYELTGVVVHTGNADCGIHHCIARTPDRTWITFSDDSVDLFDIATLPGHCFGGKDASEGTFKATSAVMLFYTRKTVDAPTHIELPPELASLVAADNTLHQVDKVVFSPAYARFLVFVMNNLEVITEGRDEVVLRVITCATAFMLDTLARAADRKIVPEYLCALQHLYSCSTQGCEWLLVQLLRDGHFWARQLLLECPARDVAAAVAGLASHALKTLSYSPLEAQAMLEDDAAPGANSEQPKHLLKPFSGMSKSTVYRFLDQLLDKLPDLYQHWTHCTQYLELFLDFALSGPLGVHYIVSRCVVGQCIDFYLGAESPYASAEDRTQRQQQQQQQQRQQKTCLPEFGVIAGLCCVVLHYVAATNGEVPKQCTAELELMTSQVFLSKALKENMPHPFLSEVIGYACKSNSEKTTAVLHSIQEILQAPVEWSSPAIFPVLTEMLHVDDPLKETRLASAVETLVNVIAERSSPNAVWCAGYLIENLDLLPGIKTLLWDCRRALLDAMIVSASDGVRDRVGRLLEYIVLRGIGDAGGDALTEETTVAKFQMLEDALSMLPLCQKHVHDPEPDLELAKRGCRFAPLFRLLFKCLQPAATPAHLRVVFDHLDQLLPFLFKVDARRIDLDESRVEIVLFCWEVMRQDSEKTFQRRITSSEELCVKLVDFYVAINSNANYVAYNWRATLPFYRIMSSVCLSNQDFMGRFLFHHNFDWALQVITLWSNDYPETAAVLQNLAKAGSTSHPRGQEFRTKYIMFLEKEDCLPQHFFPNIVKLFGILLETDEDFVNFCTRQKPTNAGCCFTRLANGIRKLVEDRESSISKDAVTVALFPACMERVLGFLEKELQSTHPRVALSPELHNLSDLGCNLLMLLDMHPRSETVVPHLFNCLVSLVKLDNGFAGMLLSRIDFWNASVLLPLRCRYLGEVIAAVVHRHTAMVPTAYALMFSLASSVPGCDLLSCVPTAATSTTQLLQSSTELRGAVAQFFSQVLKGEESTALTQEGCFAFLNNYVPLSFEQLPGGTQQEFADALVAQVTRAVATVVRESVTGVVDPKQALRLCKGVVLLHTLATTTLWATNHRDALAPAVAALTDATAARCAYAAGCTPDAVRAIVEALSNNTSNTNANL